MTSPINSRSNGNDVRRVRRRLISHNRQPIYTLEEFLDRISRYFEDQNENYYQPESSGITYFRGHNNRSYKLEPSLFRPFVSPYGESLPLYTSEQAMIHDSLQLIPDEFSGLSSFEILCKLQHFGLPTRLLDITGNPLVALYFAVSGGENTDGEVVLIPPVPSVPDTAPGVVALSEFALRGRWSNFNPADFHKGLPPSVKDQIESHSKLVKLIRKPWTIVKPYYTNPRIRAQQGAFMIFGVRTDQVTGNPAVFELSPASFNTQDLAVLRPQGFSRLIIPATAKSRIRKQLDRIGTNRASLFPEVESQLGYIKDAYTAGLRGSEKGWERKFYRQPFLPGMENLGDSAAR